MDSKNACQECIILILADVSYVSVLYEYHQKHVHINMHGNVNSYLCSLLICTVNSYLLCLSAPSSGSIPQTPFLFTLPIP